MSRFQFGSLISTPTIKSMMAKDQQFRRFITKSFENHVNCNWGKVDKDTISENEQAIVDGKGTIYSVYHYNDGEKIVRIKTDLDEGRTLILFFDESSI